MDSFGRERGEGGRERGGERKRGRGRREKEGRGTRGIARDKLCFLSCFFVVC